MYGAVRDPAQSGLWRVQLWEELRDRVTVSTDKVSCPPGPPLRITGMMVSAIFQEPPTG